MQERWLQLPLPYYTWQMINAVISECSVTDGRPRSGKWNSGICTSTVCGKYVSNGRSGPVEGRARERCLLAFYFSFLFSTFYFIFPACFPFLEKVVGGFVWGR